MKLKLLMTMLVVLQLCGCMAAMPVVEGEIAPIQKVVELPGQTKDQIYEKSKMWLAQNFKSAKAVLEYENKVDGVIIGNGSISRPVTEINAFGEGIITFNLKEEIKDNKARMTFDNFMVVVAPSRSQYYSSPGGEYPVWMKGDWDGLKEKIDSLVQGFSSYMLQAKAADNW